MLSALGVEFIVDAADIDESTVVGESARDYVMRVAIEKSMTVSRRHEACVVLAADTTVDLDGAILAKPLDAADAEGMLHALSGRSHETHTAVAVASDAGVASQLVTTEVTFRHLSNAEITWYVDTGEPLDKAGAYGLQGRAAAFVSEISGSVSNVIGLPLAETVMLLRDAGVRIAGA